MGKMKQSYVYSIKKVTQREKPKGLDLKDEERKCRAA
jgi:hypothetical protein